MDHLLDLITEQKVRELLKNDKPKVDWGGAFFSLPL